jgi:hypothetical protein
MPISTALSLLDALGLPLAIMTEQVIILKFFKCCKLGDCFKLGHFKRTF